MENFVQFEIAGGVGRITLNRPAKRNALTRDFVLQLDAAVKKMEAAQGEEGVRVVIVSANGPVFCAGMDLSEMQQRATTFDGEQQYQLDSEAYANLLKRLFQLNVPTIAVVGGPVFAGGVGLVLACDFIVGSDAASFSLPEPKRGIVAAMVTPLLIHRIGSGPANHLLLSGEPMSMQRAFELGLCYELVVSDELESRVEKLIHNVLASSRLALELTKKHALDCSPTRVTDAVTESIGVSATARQTGDAGEGLAAFLEKRKPNWDASNQ